MYRVCILLIFCGLSSCKHYTLLDTGQKVQVRTTVTASGSGSVQCTVCVEGPNGESVSGALVVLWDETNKAAMLSYDSSTCTYSTAVEEQEGETMYTIEVATILLDAPVVQKIPYAGLSKKPDITVFQDAAGNSVLNGQTLSKNTPLQIAWTSCGNGIVYQLAVKTALKMIYAISSNAETVTIPADIIPAGVYTLEILAQKISGDPNFKKADYCSTSSSKSLGITFNVN
jgi:hypothetical protein